jgi:hypothetical protein
MSLSVLPYSDGLFIPELPAGLSTSAGGEGTRTSLWAVPVVRSLGATYLPRLAVENLFIPYEETGAFLSECGTLLANLPAIATAAAVQPTAEANEWYIESILVTVIMVTHWARTNDYGVLIW